MDDNEFPEFIGGEDASSEFVEEEALWAQTYIEEEKGQWIVFLEVTFLDRIVLHRVGVYMSRRKAEIAAEWIYRAANRDIRNLPSS